MSEPVVFWDGKNQFEIGNLTVKSYGNDSTWIPLYTHPMRELTDEEIVDALCLNDEDFMVYIATSPQAKEKLIQRGRAVLKKAREQ